MAGDDGQGDVGAGSDLADGQAVGTDRGGHCGGGDQGAETAAGQLDGGLDV